MQAYFALCCALLSAYVHIYLQPYLLASDNLLAGLALLTLAVQLLIGVLLRTPLGANAAAGSTTCSAEVPIAGHGNDTANGIVFATAALTLLFAAWLILPHLLQVLVVGAFEKLDRLLSSVGVAFLCSLGTGAYDMCL